jgi:outer membrane receptor protein involved in Fe transport
VTRAALTVLVFALVRLGSPGALADEPTEALLGVVEDPRGAPVRSAEVVAEGAAARTATGEDGTFTLALPPGVRAIRVRAPGFAEETRALPLPLTKPLVIVLRPALAERLTVTATLLPTRLAETPASLVVLGPEGLAVTAASRLDDALRQVVGFSLFRRTGSRTANPTAQGVSLRGLGASGASRALVLVDGQTLNDPFGGWVYWGRVPRDAVGGVEVLRGGASDLYGSTALGGVVQVLTRPLPPGPELRASASAGNEGTLDGSFAMEGRAGAWGSRLAAAGFRTDGFVPVEEASRGPVDTRAASRHGVVDLRIERSWAERGRVFARGAFFGESRENGTPLQTNDTRVREGALGGEWSSPGLGSLRARLDLASQVFNQSFTAVSADRKAETLTRRQRVPARSAGLALQWRRALGGKHVALAGLEVRNVKGASDELAFVAGLPTANVDAGGRARTVGVFAEDLFQVTSRLLVVGAARFEHWRQEDGFSETRPLAPASPVIHTAFPDRGESALSPRVSVLFRAAPGLSLVAAGYGAFRGPTLNELYRSFRVGDTLTLANERLTAERLAGGEAGAHWTGAAGRLRARATAFSSAMRDPVANVTRSVRPGLVTRQRQNLGRTRSQGLEAEVEAMPRTGLHLGAGYTLTAAQVRRFPANQALEGRQLPQIPRHQLTFQASYERPQGLRVALQGRWSGAQFEDDQNQLRLAPAFQLDALAAHGLGRGLEAFAAAENLLDERVDVGLTPVRTLGPPFTVRAGLRLRLPTRAR